MVYAGGYDGHVYALEAETGKVQWEFPSADGSQATSDGRIVASPTIAGDLLLVPTDGGTLFFLDRQTGETLRTFDAVGPLWSAPRVEGDTAYLASLSHTLYAIDLTSAEQRWSVDLGYAIADSPTLEASLLLTGVLGDSLVALRAQDGNQSWTIPTAGWLWGSPAVQDGLAYFGDATPTGWTTKDGQGNVYAVDLTSRETIWQKPTAAVSNSPLIVDGRLIVGFENGELIAYDLADGTVVWDALAAGPIQGDPVVADGKLIVGVTSPKTVLQAFDSATGDSAWTFPAVTDS
jgi:outer membrane protein assembly factor BamB